MGKLGGRLEVKLVSLEAGALPFKVVLSLLHFGTSSSGWDDGGAAGPEMRRGRILPPSRLLSFDCLPIRAAIGQTASRPRAALGLFLLLEPDPGVASRSMTARLPIRSAHESEMQTWGFSHIGPYLLKFKGENSRSIWVSGLSESEI